MLGDFQIRVHGANAMVEPGAQSAGFRRNQPDANDVARASVAVAEAKVLNNDAALYRASKSCPHRSLASTGTSWSVAPKAGAQVNNPFPAMPLTSIAPLRRQDNFG